MFTCYEFFLPRFDFGLLSRGHRVHYTIPNRIQLWFDAKIVSCRSCQSASAFHLRILNAGLERTDSGVFSFLVPRGTFEALVRGFVVVSLLIGRYDQSELLHRWFLVVLPYHTATQYWTISTSGSGMTRKSERADSP